MDFGKGTKMNRQQILIDKMTHEERIQQLSLLLNDKVKHRDLIEYIESTLDRLNRETAMIELGDFDDLEGLSR